MEDNTVLSLLLNAEMDSLGFSKDSVRRRVEMYNKRSKAKAIASRKLLGCDYKEKIIVGSRRDGIATVNSDTDVLLINKGVFCSTDAKELDKIDDKVCILLENKVSPPGYTFLSLYKYNDRKDEYFKDIESSTEFYKGKMYLSSNKYMSVLEDQQIASRRGWFGKAVRIGTRKGPAIPKTLDTLGFEADLVGALTASCKHITRNWQAKERLHEWPSEKSIENVARLPVYVVAVGEHGSPDENLLWRISFNEPEMLLIQSMNDSQTKVLIMMRILAKNLVTPVCPDITSYVIKNIVLHAAEQNPLKEFSKERLINRILDCFKYLRSCIEEKTLLNYMNPERNLFHGKLKNQTMVSDALHIINNIIENGSDVFLFYLTNKMKPGNIRSRYPSILAVRESLIQGCIEDMFAQKKVKAMTLDKLINFHIQADSCGSETKLLLLEIYYVYIPFYLKYGIKSLTSDLKKVHSHNGMESVLLHIQGESSITGSCDDVNQTGVLEKDGDPALTSGDFKQDEADGSIQSKRIGERVMETNTFARKASGYISVLLWKLFCVMKSLLLNLFEVLHLLCVFWTWKTVRNLVWEDSVNVVDIVGVVWIIIAAISVMQKKIAPILNFGYMITLLSVLWMRMSYTDKYTLYFQELYVMLDPQQQRKHNFRTTDLNMDDLGYFDTKRPIYV